MEKIIIKTVFFLIFLSFSLAYGQTKNERLILEKTRAEQALEFALSGEPQHNVIDSKTAIIRDSLTAINVAESILFSIYGEENIVKQRPYKIHLIDNHWIINGTLRKGFVGGTFLIIIDSKDSKIIKITHGK